MHIERIVPQGYCKGVQRAIQKVLALASERSDVPITIYGPLVHNEHVIQALKDYNIRTLSDLSAGLDGIKEGIVVFSAHGIPQQMIDQAQARGLEVVTTTCPFVLSSHQLIQKKLLEGKQIMYIGHKNHPECVAALSIDPSILLVENEQISQGIDKPVYVINQTTLAIPDLQNIHQAIHKIYPDAEFADEICAATRKRQQAVLALNASDYDLALIVGDPRSSNSRKLFELAQKKGIPSRMVQSWKDLVSDDFRADRIALLSGASTPLFLVEQIEQALYNRPVPSASAENILKTRI